MILIRVGFLMIILWVAGRYEWQAIIAGDPLPLSWVQVLLFSIILGDLALQSLVLSSKREWQRLDHRAEDPPRRWMLPVTSLLILGIVIAIFYGRVSFNLSFIPGRSAELHKAPFAVLIGFAVGFFSHAGVRMDESARYRQRIKQLKAVRARIDAQKGEQARLALDAASEKAKEQAIAENLWGKPAEQPRGSVPTARRRGQSD